MFRFKYITFHLAVILILAISTKSNCSPLKFVPITLRQPDGTVLNVYASGDEFYNWVHDKDNYTILPNPATGFYVYAEVKDGKLVPTDYVVGRVDPRSTSLKAGENVFPQRLVGTQTSQSRLMKATSTQVFPEPNAPVVGNRYNLVLFIRFSDEPEFSDPISKYDNMLNNVNGQSLKHFYKEASYNQINISSYFFPQAASIISYQDTHARNYYKRYDVNTNRDGYTNDNGARELALLKNALEFVKPQIPAGTNLDGNNDGFIDNVIFIIDGGPEAWADLLWPHRSTYPYSSQTYAVSINGKKVLDYNFQLQNMTSYSVLDHEMGHSLGLPDLYRYTNTEIDPMGEWDLMSSNTMHMDNYMKWKYLGWIPTLTEIKQSGTYWLKKSTSTTKNIYAIKSPRSAQEFFVLEYRSQEGSYERNIPGSGLLVYRINNNEYGNAVGPPDEIYAYRPYGTMSTSGDINHANFGSDYGRTQINDLTDPSSFLSDGLPGGLSIKNISAVADSMKFDVEIINNLVENNDYTVQTTNYNWIDISQTGTRITNWMNGTDRTDWALDDGYSSTSISLGFEFTFFNQKFTSLFVGINGLVSFTDQFLNFYSSDIPVSATQSGYFDNNLIYWPGNKYFPNSIAAGYADYNIAKSTGGGGRILYKTIGDKFILSWLNIGKSGGTASDTTNSFQLVLDRNNNNSVTINYKKFDQGNTRKEVKVGMQRDQGSGVGWINSGDWTERIPKDSSAVVLTPKSIFTISAKCNPPLSGTATGGGTFTAGQTASITLKATANAGYTFLNWTDGGTVVSTSNPYSLNSITSKTLVANFEVQPLFDIQPTYFDVSKAAGSVTFQLMNRHYLNDSFNIQDYQVNANWINYTSSYSSIYFASVNQTFFYSANTGASRVGQITITPENKAGTSKTVEIRQAGTTNNVNNENGIPTSFILSQNYPNPFNPSTIIKYGLPRQSNVKIIIYDLLGRVMFNMVDQFQDAGYHEAELKLSRNNYSLSSGIYFYRMTAGEFSAVRKMIILK